MAYCSISTWSPTLMASAPPEPPSPMMVVMMGTSSCAISKMLRPMASDWPRSSASMPG
jgi:hypothetical protein